MYGLSSLYGRYGTFGIYYIVLECYLWRYRRKYQHAFTGNFVQTLNLEESHNNTSIVASAIDNYRQFIAQRSVHLCVQQDGVTHSVARVCR